MQVISDAKELEKHTYIKTRNPNIFPKKERLGLAQQDDERGQRPRRRPDGSQRPAPDRPAGAGAAIPGATLSSAQLPES